MDPRHLLERQLAGQHHRVGPLREELHGLGVGDVALRGDMHLLADAAGVEDGREVGGDDGVDPLGLGPVDDGVHVGQLVFVDDRVDRQIGFDACGMGRADDPRKVVEREVRGRTGAHVEPPHAEIDGVGSGVDSRRQCFVGPHGGHDLYVGTLHRFVVVELGPGPKRTAACAGPQRTGRFPHPESRGGSGRPADYFFRFIRPTANSRIRAVRAASTESVSSSARARSKRTVICCSVSRGISSRS